MYKYLFSNNNNKPIIYNSFQIVLNHSSSLSTNIQENSLIENNPPANILENKEEKELDITEIYNSNLGDFEYDLCQEKQKEKQKEKQAKIEIYDIYENNIPLDEINPMKNQE